MANTLPALHLYRYTTATPIGEFVLLVDDEGAVRLSNWTEFEGQAVRRLQCAYRPREVVIESASTVSDKADNIDVNDVRLHALRQIKRYFSYSPSSGSGGSHHDDSAETSIRHQDLHALLSSVRVYCNPSTPFLQRVWEALRELRCGDITTYGGLAAACNHPNAYRAVGQAVGMNHACVFLPCHRVVGAAQAVTGFSAGLWRKSWLLQHEQAPIPAAQISCKMAAGKVVRKRGRQ